MLMAIVWIVALSIGDHVRHEYFLTHFLGFGAAITALLVIVDRFAPINHSASNRIDFGRYDWILLAVPIALIAIYFILLGNIPLVDAIRANEYYAITKIRTDISKSGFPESYIPTLVTRSIGPAIIIYFLHTNRLKPVFLVFLLTASLGLLTITKGHVIFATFPIVLYCVLTRRALLAAMLLAPAVIIIYAVMVVTNPAANTACKFSSSMSDPGCQVTAETSIEQGVAVPAPEQGKAAPAPEDGILTSALENSGAAAMAPTVEKLAGSFVRRAFMVPGQVVAEWFEIFPATVTFKWGCGYRFLAPIIGCKFQQNARLVYAIQFPERAAQGILGNKNAAHFMEEYANFGVPGLFLAGALAAVAISVATLIMCKISLPAFLSINMIFILMLTSTSLHTTLLSGGWFMAMIT
ncbi:MAG: hypothetical protein QE284_15155, partial [Rhizobium sp.]|nr:hypothetical protein [Rhizobium sp.]